MLPFHPDPRAEVAAYIYTEPWITLLEITVVTLFILLFFAIMAGMIVVRGRERRYFASEEPRHNGQTSA